MAIWPLARVNISDNYGWRTHPISGARRHHNGLDFAAASGTPLLAIAKMRLISKGSNLGPNGAGHWARWQLVDEPTVEFDYWHQLEAIPYAHGTVKDVGERVGTVGSTGASTGPHLHLEMRHAGELRDPKPWLIAATAAPLKAELAPAPEIQKPVQEDTMFVVFVDQLGHFLVTPTYVRLLKDQPTATAADAVTGFALMTKPVEVVPFPVLWSMWVNINAGVMDDSQAADRADVKALAESLGLAG